MEKKEIEKVIQSVTDVRMAHIHPYTKIDLEEHLTEAIHQALRQPPVAGRSERFNAPQTIIVIITPTLQTIECWGNLKKACIAHGWAYNTLSKRKLPIEYEGYRIERVPLLSNSLKRIHHICC